MFAFHTGKVGRRKSECQSNARSLFIVKTLVKAPKGSLCANGIQFSVFPNKLHRSQKSCLLTCSKNSKNILKKRQIKAVDFLV